MTAPSARARVWTLCLCVLVLAALTVLLAAALAGSYVALAIRRALAVLRIMQPCAAGPQERARRPP